jgi:hypothetical protein
MKASILLGAVTVLLYFGCSDSTAPQTTYPLLLTTVSDTIVNNSAIFNFRVTNNGVGVAGAKLRRTNFPSNKTADLGVKSDSSGFFPRVAVVLTDTLSGVAYQAVRDSLTSNYIRWTP